MPLDENKIVRNTDTNPVPPAYTQSDSNPKTVVFILSREYGGPTYARHIEEAIKELPYINPHFIYFDREQFKTDISKINFFLRWIMPFRNSFIIYSIYREKLPDHIDGLFFFSFELPVRFQKFLTRYPTILAFDGTLIGSHRLKLQCFPGFFARLEFFLKTTITFPFLYSMAKKVAHFFPLTTWAQKSLIHDFRINKNKITVVPGGFDQTVWQPNPAKTTLNAPPRLLFVGNQFERKGGPFLLSLFTNYIYPRAQLIIISNDPLIDQSKLPAGVTLIKGLTKNSELLEYYQNADIFVFPTRLEQMGHVLIEAAFTGLPLLASDIGGVSEIVRDQENGFLLPYHASEQQWAEKITEIINNRQLYLDLRNKSISLAQNEWSRSVFVNHLDQTFKKIFKEKL